MCRVISIVLIFCMVFVGGIGAAAAADSMEGFPLTIMAKDYIRSYDSPSGSSQVPIEVGNVAFTPNDWTEYEVNVEKAGIYRLSITAGSGSSYSATLEVVVNGVKEHEKTLDPTGSMTNYQVNTFGEIRLNSGTNVIRIKHMVGGGMYFRSITIDFVKETVPMISYLAKDYKNSYHNRTGSNSVPVEGGYLSFNLHDWVEYNVEVPKTGFYNIYVRTGSGSTVSLIMDLFVNNKLSSSTEVLPSGRLSDIKQSWISTVKLSEGTSTFKFESAQGGCYFESFQLEYLGTEIEFVSAFADKTKLEEGIASVSRGTDRFVVNFNMAPNPASINEETVYILDDSEKVPVEYAITNNVVTIALKESLNFNKTYQLVIDGVKDLYEETQINNLSYEFRTDGSDSGQCEISVSDVSLSDKRLTVKGTYISSFGIGMAKRNVELYIKDPSNHSQLVSAVFSGENGVFEILYVFPDDYVSGKYIIRVSGEYINNAAESELYYISTEDEQVILIELQNCSTASEVQALFVHYAPTIGLNLAEGLRLLTNQDKLFEYFINAQIDSVTRLKDLFWLYAGAEAVRQSTGANHMEQVLQNTEFCHHLGIDKQKADLIINLKNEYLTALSELSDITDIQDLIDEISTLTDKYLAKEHGIEEAELILSDISVYEKQAIELPLKFTSKQTKVYKIIVYVQASQEANSLFNDAGFTSKIKAKHSILRKGDLLQVEIEPESNTQVLELVGSIMFTAPQGENRYQFRVTGKILYDIYVGPPETDPLYQLSTTIADNNVEAVVRKNTSTNVGKQFISGGSGGGSGNNTVIPINPPIDSEKPEDNQELYEFTDIADYAWANEAIYYLLNKNVISKNEEKRFRPGEQITRAEAIKMITIALDVIDENAQSTFTDVLKDEWYHVYVASAEKEEIVKGDEAKRFHPQAFITREDMALTVYRAIAQRWNLPEKSGEMFEDDSLISEYAKTAVYTLRSMSLINGMGGNVFNPKAGANRAMFAKLMFEMIKVIE